MRQIDRTITDIDVLDILENKTGRGRKRNKQKDKYIPNHKDWNYCIEGTDLNKKKIRIIISLLLPHGIFRLAMWQFYNNSAYFYINQLDTYDTEWYTYIKLFISLLHISIPLPILQKFNYDDLDVIPLSGILLIRKKKRCPDYLSIQAWKNGGFHLWVSKK